MQPPELSSKSAVLMSAENGQILISHNGKDKYSPACLVKVITCLLAVEKNNIEDIIEIKNTYQIPGEKNIGLKEGEQIQLKWLLYAALLANASDAAMAIAEHTSGSIDDFMLLANEKVKQLGCTNTNIVNPTGRYNENQYTTAEDMAIIAKAAFENPQILSILKTKKITIPKTNLSEQRQFWTNNHLISAFIENKYIYPDALGGKTGYTKQDGYNLFALASKGGRDLIVIVLGGEKKDNIIQTFNDATRLLNFGFSNFKIKTIANSGDILYELKIANAKGRDFVTLVAENSLKGFVYKNDAEPEFDKNFQIPENVIAPIKKGQHIGRVTYSYNGSEVGSINLIASSDVKPNLLLSTRLLLGYIWAISPIRYIVYGIVCIVILYLITIPPLVKYAEKKANKKYRKHRK